MESKYTYNVDPFKPIVGAAQIAKYIGMSRRNFQMFYIKPMAKAGCAWKASNKKTAKWCSMPILIAIYFYHKAISQNN